MGFILLEHVSICGGHEERPNIVWDIGQEILWAIPPDFHVFETMSTVVADLEMVVFT